MARNHSLQKEKEWNHEENLHDSAKKHAAWKWDRGQHDTDLVLKLFIIQRVQGGSNCLNIFMFKI